MKQYDVIIIGAGAAGLSAAAVARERGKRVAILEMGETPARKVMVSGGGRCNITNTDANHTRYFGENPNFVRGALSRVSAHDIIEWANRKKLSLVEKTPGRYFCENGASAVVEALMKDVRGIDIFYNTNVKSVQKNTDEFIISTNKNFFCAKSVIVATGGISFPTLGVSDIGYKIAKSFGHKIIPVRPALCALSIPNMPSELAGISIDAEIKIGKTKLHDSLLFTHFGIGGPLAYRASVRDIHNGIVINLMPNIDVQNVLRDAKRTSGKKNVTNILTQYLPNRLARWIMAGDIRNIADIKDADIEKIATRITNIIIPGNKIKLHNMASAEIVRGGVDTREISSKTMESVLCRGLFFAGEVMDVAGDLGGFNLQWAWASGRVAGQNAGNI